MTSTHCKPLHCEFFKQTKCAHKQGPINSTKILKFLKALPLKVVSKRTTRNQTQGLQKLNKTKTSIYNNTILSP